MNHLDRPEPIPYDQHEAEMKMALDDGIILGLEIALQVMQDRRNTQDRKNIENQLHTEKTRMGKS